MTINYTEMLEKVTRWGWSDFFWYDFYEFLSVGNFGGNRKPSRQKFLDDRGGTVRH